MIGQSGYLGKIWTFWTKKCNYHLLQTPKYQRRYDGNTPEICQTAKYVFAIVVYLVLNLYFCMMYERYHSLNWEALVCYCCLLHCLLVNNIKISILFNAEIQFFTTRLYFANPFWKMLSPIYDSSLRGKHTIKPLTYTHFTGWDFTLRLLVLLLLSAKVRRHVHLNKYIRAILSSGW